MATLPTPLPFRRAGLPAAGALLLALGACAGPPPEAYSRVAPATAAGQPVGADARGEACNLLPGRAPVLDRPVARAEEVFCGRWTQPSARIYAMRGPAAPADLQQLATGGVWRRGIEERLSCAAPQPTTLGGGTPAVLMNCTRRSGGWAHVALVAAGPEGPVVADGTLATAPLLERLITGRAGQAGAGQARSDALQAAVSRLSARAFAAGDIGEYDRLMQLGRELNLVENFAGAEEAYRAALAIQDRAENRDTIGAVMHLALNLSNQRRYQEAEAFFRRADALAPGATDRVAPARLLHYRGLHALNQGRDAEAARLLDAAEAAYLPFVPPSLLQGGGGSDLVAVSGSVGGFSTTLQGQSALIGLAEVRRYRAAALARTGQRAEGLALLADSRRLLRNAAIEPGAIAGRALRLEASLLEGEAAGSAAVLVRAAQRFRQAAPDERPEATTLFLAGQRFAQAGQLDQALSAFRNGAAILRARRVTLTPEEVVPYLDALDAQARRAAPAEATALRAEMFTAAQLAQRGETVRFVARATVRLGTGSEAGASAVRELQDIDNELRTLFAERDATAAAGTGRAAVAGLDERIAERQAARGRAEERVAEEVPNFRQLGLAATEAARVGEALRREEALVLTLLGREHGYAIAVLPGGAVTASRIALGEAGAAELVRRIRASIDNPAARRGFDTAAAQDLHARLFGPLETALAGTRALVVVPDGPLLGIPFGLLLTGPAAGDLAALRDAPWLIRRVAISHSLSPQIFVAERARGTVAAAPLPYLGFGDFRPPSDAQLRARFPAEVCAQDAQIARGLAPLPGTRLEVELTRRTLGAPAGAARFGADFTAASLAAAPLDQYRILHFATHALLPGELSCVPEPSLVVSPARNAPDAASAFVPASDLLRLRLNADLVLLSACNTAGPATGVPGQAANAGEALSGLARSFFFAGARGLLVTHWPAGDRAAAATVIQTMRRQQAGEGSADALRSAQLALLEEAGRDLPASFAHPFFWAGFALVGDGARPAAAPQRMAEAARGTN